jgi:GNAT superfamily N-acetyltransferase
LYFHNYSTFLGQKGLYLEDLFVSPDRRGHGIGKALLVQLARIAKERNCGRLEWAVLDWNEPAINFYKSLNAKLMDEWRTFRVTGEALETLANGSRQAG